MIFLPNSLPQTHTARFLMHHNQITGPIPEFVWENTNLFELDLEENQFTGTISTKLGQLATSLQVLQLGGNQFVGQIPNEIYSMPELKFIRFRDNQLTGRLTNEWEALNKTLEDFDLSNNPFTGPIPQGFDLLSNLGKFCEHGGWQNTYFQFQDYC